MPKGKKLKLKNVGTRIRAWRKSVPLKSFELAAILGLSQGSLSDIENNKSLPSADTIVAFHLNTDLNIIYMLTGIKGDKMDKPVFEAGVESLTITFEGLTKQIIIKKNE